jgi:hypothetical protein
LAQKTLQKAPLGAFCLFKKQALDLTTCYKGDSFLTRPDPALATKGDKMICVTPQTLLIIILVAFILGLLMGFDRGKPSPF